MNERWLGRTFLSGVCILAGQGCATVQPQPPEPIELVAETCKRINSSTRCCGHKGKMYLGLLPRTSPSVPVGGSALPALSGAQIEDIGDGGMMFAHSEFLRRLGRPALEWKPDLAERAALQAKQMRLNRSPGGWCNRYGNFSFTARDEGVFVANDASTLSARKVVLDWFGKRHAAFDPQNLNALDMGCARVDCAEGSGEIWVCRYD